MDLKELREKHRDFILKTAEEHGLTNIRVFGSVARGDAKPGSDLDLLVDLQRRIGLFTLLGFQHKVEDTLLMPVQVVTAESLSPYFRDTVLGYAEPL